MYLLPKRFLLRTIRTSILVNNPSISILSCTHTVTLSLINSPTDNKLVFWLIRFSLRVVSVKLSDEFMTGNFSSWFSSETFNFSCPPWFRDVNDSRRFLTYYTLLLPINVNDKKTPCINNIFVCFFSACNNKIDSTKFIGLYFFAFCFFNPPYNYFDTFFISYFLLMTHY